MGSRVTIWGMPTSRPARLLLLPCAALLLTALTGCSSDGSSDASGDPTSAASSPSSSSSEATGAPSSGPEADAVCAAYHDSAITLSAVKTHLKDHDLDQARVSLTDAGVAMGELTKAVSGLSPDLRTTLKPRTQEIASQVDVLDAAESVEQLKAGLSVIEMEARRLTTDIKAALTCSS